MVFGWFKIDYVDYGCFGISINFLTEIKLYTTSSTLSEVAADLTVVINLDDNEYMASTSADATNSVTVSKLTIKASFLNF